MTQAVETYDDILHFWFGRVEETIVPSEHRARIWFGEDVATDQEIKDRFAPFLQEVIAGKFDTWEQSSRGQLALIITLDQFTRHIYRGTLQAFAQDERAISICLDGIRHESDHSLSLIERVFYYFPLLHSEKIAHQEQSVRSYRTLVDLAFSETRVIFDSFLKFANHHYAVVSRFGRFPQRNEALNRTSTQAEIDFLKEIKEHQ